MEEKMGLGLYGIGSITGEGFIYFFSKIIDFKENVFLQHQSSFSINFSQHLSETAKKTSSKLKNV